MLPERNDNSGPRKKHEPQSYQLRLAHNPLVLRSSLTSSFERPWHLKHRTCEAHGWLPASDCTHSESSRHVVPSLDWTSAFLGQV